MKQCFTQSFKPVTLLLQAFRRHALHQVLPYLPGGHCKISFTWCALREWWLLQSLLVGCHHLKGQRELPLENIHKCLLFPFDSRPQSLSATHRGRLRKVKKGCWMPGKAGFVTWNHYTQTGKKGLEIVERYQMPVEQHRIRVMSKEVSKREVCLAWAVVPA